MIEMCAKILVIDDDPDILEAVQLLLESEGYKVVTASKGDHAYSLKTDLPDLILLDVLLSGQDGREIATFLKKQTLTSQIPIVMMSAHPTINRTINKRMADDFIPKPFDIDVLLGKIRAYLPAT